MEADLKSCRCATSTLLRLPAPWGETQGPSRTRACLLTVSPPCAAPSPRRTTPALLLFPSARPAPFAPAVPLTPSFCSRPGLQGPPSAPARARSVPGPCSEFPGEATTTPGCPSHRCPLSRRAFRGPGRGVPEWGAACPAGSGDPPGAPLPRGWRGTPGRGEGSRRVPVPPRRPAWGPRVPRGVSGGRSPRTMRAAAGGGSGSSCAGGGSRGRPGKAEAGRAGGCQHLAGRPRQLLPRRQVEFGRPAGPSPLHPFPLPPLPGAARPGRGVGRRLLAPPSGLCRKQAWRPARLPASAAETFSLSRRKAKPGSPQLLSPRARAAGSWCQPRMVVPSVGLGRKNLCPHPAVLGSVPLDSSASQGLSLHVCEMEMTITSQACCGDAGTCITSKAHSPEPCPQEPPRRLLFPSTITTDQSPGEDIIRARIHSMQISTVSLHVGPGLQTQALGAQGQVRLTLRGDPESFKEQRP